MISSATAKPQDASIRAKLFTLKELFFDSLCGTNLLFEFDASWNQFCQTVRACVENLSDDTISLILSFAEAITIIVPGILDVESEGDRIGQQLQEDISRLTGDGLSKLAISDSHLEDSYNKSAHAWLLDNLHNPYPSLEIRTSIAHKHRCSRKRVDNWFVDARKRIGWNDIRKSYFPRKADLISAATRFFNGDVLESLPSHCESSFVDMMIRAKSLPLMDEKCSAAAISKRRHESDTATFSYPSPEHSTASSPEPPSPLLSKKSLSINPNQLVETSKSTDRSKTHESSSHDILHNFHECSGNRESSVSDFNQSISQIPQLPSPTPSADSSPSRVAHLSLPYSDLVSATITKPANVSKRKRRLSDVGSENDTKRQCRQISLQDVGHNVNAPYLSSRIVDDIAAYDFCSPIPEPVRIADFGNEPFSIECMSYQLSPEDEVSYLRSATPPFVGAIDWFQDNSLSLIPFADQLSGNISDIHFDDDILFNWDPIDFGLAHSPFEDEASGLRTPLDLSAAKCLQNPVHLSNTLQLHTQDPTASPGKSLTFNQFVVSACA